MSKVSVAPQDPALLLAQAKASVLNGDLLCAESLCQQVLARFPSHADALLLFGVIEQRRGHRLQAVTFFERAMSVGGGAMAAALLGDTLLEMGRCVEALAAFERALRVDPQLIPASFGRANALFDAGRFEESLTAYRQLTRGNANNPEFWLGEGNALLALDRKDPAFKCFDRALTLDPRFTAALCSRGRAQLARGRLTEALRDFDQALELGHTTASIHVSRGDVLASLQRTDDARRAFERALLIDPQNEAALCGRAEALTSGGRPEDARLSLETRSASGSASSRLLVAHGNACAALCRWPQALASYDAAWSLNERDISALTNSASALMVLGRYPDALARAELAARQRPDFAPALRAHADVLMKVGRFDAAAAELEALLTIEPDAKYVAGLLRHARAECAVWEPEKDRAMEAAVIQGAPVAMPFDFLAVSDDPAAQLACARQYLAHAHAHAHAPAAHPRPMRSSRIRVAYLSPDFHDHALSRLAAGLFESHDRGLFEIFAVSLRPIPDTPMGRRLQDAFEHVIDASAMSNQLLVEVLRARNIEVAVDLAGLTDGARPQVLTERIAPVQINYLGYPGSLGHPGVDYIIADDYVIPPELTDQYAEQTIYLPHCFQVNDLARAPSGTPTRLAHGLPESAFVFACFNNLFKINAGVFQIWMQLLAQVRGSCLWMLASNVTAQRNLRAHAIAAGIDDQRLIFADRLPYPEHLARLPLADLFLDTFPFNGGAVVSDALYMGLPVVSCSGRSFASRMAGSLLRASGLPTLSAADLADYSRIARELAQDRARLSAIRYKLRNNRGTRPLFDPRLFCRHLESAFDYVVKRSRQGDPQRAVTVDAEGHASLFWANATMAGPT